MSRSRRKPRFRRSSRTDASRRRCDEVIMAATRFEGRGPVARYWLAHCEGFAVEGGAHGIVEELLTDVDPPATSRLLVRTRRGRLRVIPVSAVATVSPAERTVVVNGRSPKPKPRRTRRAVGRVTAAAVPRLRAAIELARPR